MRRILYSRWDGQQPLYSLEADQALDALSKLAPDGARAGAALVFGVPFSNDSCTDLMGVSVRLRQNGRRPGKLQIKAVARGVGRPAARDVDKIRLVCLP